MKTKTHNEYFMISCFAVYGDDMPLDFVKEGKDFLSDMNDGYEISYFCKAYPNHNIEFVDNGNTSQFDIQDGKSFSCHVKYSNYIKWSENMKSFWHSNIFEDLNEFQRKYRVISLEDGVKINRPRYSYDSDEMNSLLINPLTA